MKKPATLDETVVELIDIAGEAYSQEYGIGIDRALELVLSPHKEGIQSNFYKYNWTTRRRESDVPAATGLLAGQTITVPRAYQKMLSSLVGKNYFVEELNNTTILLQPFAAVMEQVTQSVDHFIDKLKINRDISLEPPRIGDTEESYRRWLETYHELNGMGLPPHFYRLDKVGLRGMFYGINDPAKLEKRLRERQFVIELYHAHDAKLPADFDKWGHKRVEGLYKKLTNWYGGISPRTSDAQPQLPFKP